MKNRYEKFGGSKQGHLKPQKSYNFKSVKNRYEKFGGSKQGHLKPQKSYNCHHCFYCFKDKETIATHDKVCTEKNTFQCNFCPCAFKIENQLKKHISLRHPNLVQTSTDWIKDEVIKKSSDVKSQEKKENENLVDSIKIKKEIFDLGMETPENASVINCSKKPKLEQEEDLFKQTEIKDPLYMKNHKMCLEEKNPFKCSKCEFYFATIASLQEHFTSAHEKLQPFELNFEQIKDNVIE